MKFLGSLTKHRFHVLGVGITYAHMIGWMVGFVLFAAFVR